MNRGEVWTVTAPNGIGRWRVAVVSADAYNDRSGALPFVVPLIRRPAGDLPPYTAALADPDPVGGVALVADMGQVDSRQATERVGMLTGGSMARIGAALRDLFEL
jgi:mRNA interferase MazF